MITARTVAALGLSQLICWGVSYYMIGCLGDAIVADVGWEPAFVYGGFSVALVTMGVVSSLVGRTIDRYGGRRVMVLGSCVLALGCVIVALAHSRPTYIAGWVCLGIAMRMTLYDAAFAALNRMGGMAAKRAIAQVTVLGGLASTVFWPIGHFLNAQLGWRGALGVYSMFALATAALHGALVAHSTIEDDPRPPAGGLPFAASGLRPPSRAGAAVLYSTIVTLTSLLNAALSAHMIGMLAGLGLGLTEAVRIAALRGVGQSASRMADVLSRSRLHPLTLNIVANLTLPCSFALGLIGGRLTLAAYAFSFLSGVANGLLTITRGTLPLVLFEQRTYGVVVGSLLFPSFLASAAAPLLYAMVIDRAGSVWALVLSAGVAAVALGAAILLRLQVARHEIAV